MTKEDFCKNVLKDLSCENVNVVVSDNIKGNYYSYLNNTIYLNNIDGETKEEKVKEKVVVAHECIHAGQNRTLHILNIVLSNIEIIMFLVLVLFAIYSKIIPSLFISYIVVCLLSFLIRGLLEIPAMINSFNLAEQYCDSEEQQVLKDNKQKLKYILPIGILSFAWFRLLRLIIILIII